MAPTRIVSDGSGYKTRNPVGAQHSRDERLHATRDISVTVTPSSGSVMLGNQFQFTAAVKNSSDSAVTWRVNGVAGGAARTTSSNPRFVLI
jgi:hypothetical protein